MQGQHVDSGSFCPPGLVKASSSYLFPASEWGMGSRGPEMEAEMCVCTS